ncbi:hypothetical protein [Paenibacillus sp. FSL R7-0337]|nr:hypothetical protein [Paenibacillus sp. FSL R7-0337]
MKGLQWEQEGQSTRVYGTTTEVMQYIDAVIRIYMGGEDPCP